MRHIIFVSLVVCLFCFTTAKAQAPVKTDVDFIVANATIYTTDANMSIAHYMAVKDGIIYGMGVFPNEVFDKFTSKNVINMEGQYIYPGFNDAHCHFYGLGLNQAQADLKGCNSFDEVLKRLAEYCEKNKEKKMKWVLGRGWDQNAWKDHQFPSKEKLDSMFPKTPVMLKRVDGHAVLVNSKALKLAKIKAGTKVSGGEIKLDDKGQPNGILIDNAVDLVEKKLPKIKPEEMEAALLAAQQICISNGLTSVQDAGLDLAVVQKMDELQKAGKLKIRMYAMLNPTEENFEYFVSKGPYHNGRLHVQSVKLYADGALGSRGACLLEFYSDRQDHYGMMLHDTAYLRKMAERVFKAGYQLNTHCIGDSAARVMLKIYGSVLKGTNDRRWRIEHAQMVHPADWPMFAKYSILPSVQPAQVSSDKSWIVNRVNRWRMERVFAFRSLLMFSQRMPLGTDFPVEEVNPMGTLFSAVTRTTVKEFPEGGFQPQNALTIYEAMKGMTYWSAYAQFEEKTKGCLERGKVADFVVYDQDLMQGVIVDVFKAKLLATYINGEKVYEAK